MVAHGAGAHGFADLRFADDWCAGFQWIRAWDPGENGYGGAPLRNEVWLKLGFTLW